LQKEKFSRQVPLNKMPLSGVTTMYSHLPRKKHTLYSKKQEFSRKISLATLAHIKLAGHFPLVVIRVFSSFLELGWMLFSGKMTIDGKFNQPGTRSGSNDTHIGVFLCSHLIGVEIFAH
jgi:hypothetical protein